MAEVLEAPAEVKVDTAAPVLDKPDAEAKPEPKYTQEEMDRITAKVKKNAAYRARKEAEAYYKGLQQGSAIAKPEPEKVVEDKAPTRDQFDSYEAFLEAKAKHVASTAVREERTKVDAEVKAKTTAEAQAKAFETFQAKTREKFPDLEERIESIGHIVMPEGMGQAITESDFGPEILDHFAKNPKDCERIAALTGSAAQREIGKLEAKLEGAIKPAAETPQAPVKPASKAPEPIKPGGGGSPADDRPSDADDINEWMRKERARLRKQRS